MPRTSINGCNYYFEETGSGPETIVFGHGFLMTHRQWEAQVEALSDQYRCLALDWRGQGWSSATDTGYSIPELTNDLVQFINTQVEGPCHYVGLSMGGIVGFQLLLREPELVQSSVLMSTQAHPEDDANQLQYRALLEGARWLGFKPFIDRVLPMLFSPAFLNDPDRRRSVERWKGIIQSNDPEGVYRTGRGIFWRSSLLSQLHHIKTPVLLLAGADDVAIAPDRTRAAHERLPDSDFAVIPAAGHSAPVERPAVVADMLRRFIGNH